jgi:glycine/D-amino acid oxidase-like deaminating enzyme
MSMQSPMADPSRLPPSLWAATAEETFDGVVLEGQHHFDICIVGGGFTGLSAALHAAEAGVSVCVLEASEPGWGASGRNGGQVIPGFKWDPDELVAKFGAETGERLVSLAGEAPDKVFELIGKHDIRCAPERSGWIQGVHAASALPAVEDRCRQWQGARADCYMLHGDEARELIGSPAYVAALVEPRGGKLNPLSYARGLARAAQSAGAVVSPRSPVTALAREGAGWLVKTAQAEVSAGKVLLATNGYTGDLWPSLKQTIIPVASFIIATRPLSDNVRRSILRDGHVISDTRRMLTYSRLDPEGRLVVGARGKWADPMGVADFAHVKKTLQDLFPQVGDVGEPEFFWSGRVAITPDYLPHVHEPEPGLTMLLGFNGRGVAMATAMGAAAGRYLASGRRDDLPLPSTGIQPIPFHGARRMYVAAASAWYRLLDGFNL